MKFRVCLAGVLLFSQFVVAQEQPTSEQLYQEAYDNFVKRDYATASASLDKINAEDQKKADVLNLRGAIYKRLGELDNAANAYSDALKINPKDWVPKYNLAEVNFLRGEYKSSRSFLEQALSSMPEADRLQKQDLILYKVYLTYLLQGDEEKAKLLLDSFDINSSNPVYYFAQAAWSYKKKDVEKAATWVSSTEGLYSGDLRNSYSQALVDVGWLQPAEGVGPAALTANPAESPSVTPDPTLASASPVEPAPTASPTPDQTTASVVPLSSNAATPIAVVEPSPTPVASPVGPAPATVVPDPVVTNSPASADKGFSLTKGLIALAILGTVFYFLVNLAKRSRVVPPPEDNTGYDAITASGNPEAAASIGHTSEGTGVVLEQDEHGDIIPAPIKVSPINRSYGEEAPLSEPATVSKGRRAGGASAKAAGAIAAMKIDAVTAGKKPAATRKKTSPRKTVPAEAAATPVIAGASTKKTSNLGVSKVASDNDEAIRTGKAAGTKKPAGPNRRTKLVQVTTIDVPPPERPAPKLMVSNIEVLREDPTRDTPGAAGAEKKAGSKPKRSTKPAVKTAPTKTAPTMAPVKPAPARPAVPLITIPEFEDTDLETDAPVLRLVTEKPKPEEEPNKA